MNQQMVHKLKEQLEQELYLHNSLAESLRKFRKAMSSTTERWETEIQSLRQITDKLTGLVQNRNDLIKECSGENSLAETLKKAVPQDRILLENLHLHIRETVAGIRRLNRENYSLLLYRQKIHQKLLSIHTGEAGKENRFAGDAHAV